MNKIFNQTNATDRCYSVPVFLRRIRIGSIAAMFALFALILSYGCALAPGLPQDRGGAANVPHYRILDSDDEDLSGTSYEDVRAATLLVDTKANIEEDFRKIARDIKTDEAYRDYDLLAILFTDSSKPGFERKAAAWAALSAKGVDAVNRMPGKIADSKDNDHVFFSEP